MLVKALSAKEADSLKEGDAVITFNGLYQQNAKVNGVEKDYRGVRWITYQWTAPNGEVKVRSKRHNSVYLPVEE
jgi:hypothetical protein